MTIYVDEAKLPYRGDLYCHMMTDGAVEELHEFAQKIGMKRIWFQDKPNHPHYDLSSWRRSVAIRRGAVAVSAVEMIRRCVSREAEA